jgi:hypothetical protein
MKQCPNCRTTYTDDALRFCLADGAALVSSAPNGAETVQIPFDKNPVRVNVPLDSAPTVFTPPVSSPQSKGKGAGLIIGVVLGVLLLFLLIGGVAAFLLLRSNDDKKATGASASPLGSPTAAPSVPPPAAPIDETAALKEKLANLEKQMRDQSNQKLPAATPETSSPPKQAPTTARANSPRDGFLALRSEPNSETGARIAKIPHGATLTVLGCPKSSNVGKMSGRWCQVIYNGQSGWAFDAFMIF